MLIDDIADGKITTLKGFLEPLAKAFFNVPPELPLPIGFPVEQDLIDNAANIQLEIDRVKALTTAQAKTEAVAINKKWVDGQAAAKSARAKQEARFKAIEALVRKWKGPVEVKERALQELQIGRAKYGGIMDPAWLKAPTTSGTTYKTERLAGLEDELALAKSKVAVEGGRMERKTNLLKRFLTSL